VNGELERRAHRQPRRAAAIRTAAEAIGIDVGELRAALRDGQTIAQVAEANGVEPQDVIDALVARSTERITNVVNGDTVRQRC
jgi:prolyl-tRNA editing enzyme YbaK/EbsC (Cys-tRNA(Pro) deacylase)